MLAFLLLPLAACAPEGMTGFLRWGPSPAKACVPDPSLRSDPVAFWCLRAAELRGLQFRRTVQVKRVPRDEVAATIRAEIESALPADEIDAYRDAYAALGLLPPDIDLIEVFSAIYGGELAGRYVPRESALYLVDEAMPGGYTRETVAVHELVHALQHQRYPRILDLVEGLRHNDDVVSALAGVIEGDASFTMFGAESLDPQTDRTLESARSFRDSMLAVLRYPDGAFGRAPLLVRISVVFPYAFGTVLAAQRYRASGNAGLDMLLADAPLSTLDLLRADEPERGRVAVEFVELPLDALADALAGSECRLGDHNVAGALGLRVLFDEYTGDHDESLVDAWRGDRFLHVPCAQGSELLWVTRWRDSAAARAFREAYLALWPSLEPKTSLAGRPQAKQSDRTVVVYTPGLGEFLPLVEREMRVEAHRGLRQFVASGCPGEPEGCPGALEVSHAGDPPHVDAFAGSAGRATSRARPNVQSRATGESGRWERNVLP